MLKEKFLYVTGFLTCLIAVSCDRVYPTKLENIQSENKMHFTGKTLGQGLEYLCERYGCYDGYTMHVDLESGMLDGCVFHYYDSNYIYTVNFNFDATTFKYLPKHLPKGKPDEFKKWNFLEFEFPLQVLRKEKIESVAIKEIPIEWWIKDKVETDSLREAIIYQEVREKILKELGIQKQDTLQE